MNWLWAALGGLLLAVTVPRFDAAVLAPVALTPLLFVAAREPRWWRRLLYGELAGVIYWMFVAPWIQHVLHVHGGLNAPLAWFSWVLFCVLKALHTAAFAAGAGWLMRRAWWTAPLIAALWTGLERTHDPLGFQWFLLGNAGIDARWLHGVPPLLGVYGVSFLFALTAASLASAHYHRQLRALWWLLLPLLAVALPKPPLQESPRATAIVYQPNLPEAQVWTYQFLEERTQRMFARSAQLAAAHPEAQVILWPEAPGPFYLDSDPAFRARAHTLVRATGKPFVFTTVFRDERGPRNSAVMLDAHAELKGRYDKINLVPFGEYLPRAFFWVNKITQEAGDFIPGQRMDPFPLNSERLGVFICYEAAFPDLVRNFSRYGATVLVNLSNDGYLGGGYARDQHLAMARMRALENGRWLLRVTNSGLTAVIDPAGEVRQMLPAAAESAFAAQFNYRRETTFYSRQGDWFAWLCLGLGPAGTLFSLWRAPAGTGVR